jgi:hypothetical protein
MLTAPRIKAENSYTSRTSKLKWACSETHSTSSSPTWAKINHSRIPLVHSLPTSNRLEERMDRPQSTPNYTQDPRRSESTLSTTTNQPTQDNVTRDHIHLQTDTRTETYIGKPRHSPSLLCILKSILGRSVARVPSITTMGSCH